MAWPAKRIWVLCVSHQGTALEIATYTRARAQLKLDQVIVDIELNESINDNAVWGKGCATARIVSCA